MNSFVSEAFMCDDCGLTNSEKDVPIFDGGNYVVECDCCGGTHRVGNVYDDQVSAAHDAYNDMERGK